MTRQHDQNQPGPGDSGDDELKRRLDQARAELTGHVPTPDPRLEAVFHAGHAQGHDPADLPGAIVAIEPLTPLESPAASRRRHVAVTAIAASFLLLAGLAVNAANRSDPNSPVEVAADLAGAPQQVVTDESPDGEGDDDGGGEVNGADDNDDSDAADGGDPDSDDDATPFGSAGAHDGDPDADHGTHPHDDDGWQGLFDDELRERLESLWDENRQWIECVTAAVDAWGETLTGSLADPPADHPADGTTDRWRRLDLTSECGRPSLGGADGAFVWPDHMIPDFDFPDFDRDSFCERFESETGASITCEWPPCPTDAEAGNWDEPPRWPIICDWPPCPRDDASDTSGDDADDDASDTSDDDADDLVEPCLPFGPGPLPRLDQLLPDGWFDSLPGAWPENVLPGDFDFDFEPGFDFDFGSQFGDRDMDEFLDELLPGDWRQHLENLEDRFDDLERHFDSLEDRSGPAGASGFGSDGAGFGSGGTGA